MRKIKPTREYFGRTIFYLPRPGRLPWTTVNPGFSADTLAGIKELIRNDAATIATLSRH